MSYDVSCPVHSSGPKGIREEFLCKQKREKKRNRMNVLSLAFNGGKERTEEDRRGEERKGKVRIREERRREERIRE